MVANVRTFGGTWHPSVWYYHLRRSVAQWDVTPLQITGFYLVLGFLALYFSDVWLVQLVEDPATLSQLQAVKGGVEVVLTGGLIFVLAWQSRRALTRTNDRLERQQAELQVLHRVFRHNLRNDVNVIAGYATSLKEEVESDRHRAWCENLVVVADRIVHYADQTRRINQVTADDAVRTLDLVDVAEAAIESNRAASQAALEVSLPDAAPVRAHPMVEAALDELLTNAVAHHDREDPAVAVRVDPDGGPAHRTELVVSDDGPGIPDHVRRTIEQRGESQLLHLDGLGLWLVSWIVTVSDGELTMESRDPRGTDFRIELPKANAAPPSMWSVASLAALQR